MESLGLVALVVVLAAGGLLISVRVAMIAMRFVRHALLKRTTAVLPAVRPQPGATFASPSSRTSRRKPPRLPIDLVPAHPTLPPDRSNPVIGQYSRNPNR
jgi:hypothetical protein